MATVSGSVVCFLCCVRRNDNYDSRTRAYSSLQHHPSDAQVTVVGVGSANTFPQGRKTVVSWLEQGSASQPMRSQQGSSRNILRDSETSGSQSSTKRMKWILGSIVYVRGKSAHRFPPANLPSCVQPFPIKKKKQAGFRISVRTGTLCSPSSLPIAGIYDVLTFRYGHFLHPQIFLGSLVSSFAITKYLRLGNV